MLRQVLTVFVYTKLSKILERSLCNQFYICIYIRHQLHARFFPLDLFFISLRMTRFASWSTLYKICTKLFRTIHPVLTNSLQNHFKISPQT